MDDEMRELEERLNQRGGRSYHFYKPIGQFIDHVDTINFSMDKDGNFHFENVGQVNSAPKQVNSAPKQEDKGVSNEQLARAIENCQHLFWGNSSYAVLFCVLRDDCDMVPNKASFEERMEDLPYSKKRDFYCTLGTISNAFRNNPYYNMKTGDWTELNTSTRVILLRDALRKQLNLN